MCGIRTHAMKSRTRAERGLPLALSVDFRPRLCPIIWDFAALELETIQSSHNP